MSWKEAPFLDTLLLHNLTEFFLQVELILCRVQRAQPVTKCNKRISSCTPAGDGLWRCFLGSCAITIFICAKYSHAWTINTGHISLCSQWTRVIQKWNHHTSNPQLYHSFVFPVPPFVKNTYCQQSQNKHAFFRNQWWGKWINKYIYICCFQLSIQIRRHKWMKWGKCLCRLDSTGRFRNWGPSALSSSSKNPPMESGYLVAVADDSAETWKLMGLKNPWRRGGDGGGVEGAWDSGVKAAVKRICKINIRLPFIP